MHIVCHFSNKDCKMFLSPHNIIMVDKERDSATLPVELPGALRQW